MEVTWDAVAPVVEELVGAVLADPVDLGGSARTVVWRVVAGGVPLVVKVHRPEEAAGYAREVSALEVLTGTGTLPDLVGHDDASRVIVMQDLGERPHLADALLGDDPVLARQRLDRWVDALAALHDAATPARRRTFAEAVAGRGAEASSAIEEQPGTAHDRYAEVLPGLGLDDALPDLVAALELAPTLMSEQEVISPGDVCPDNNADLGDRLVLLDLEGAQLLHPALDLAYLTVPWPSCWCSWALPDDVVAAAVRRYEAARGLEPVAVAHDLAVATLLWAVVSPGWFLSRALHPETGDAEDDPRVPTRRAMVQHRLRVAAGIDAPRGLEALPVFAERLHAALAARWGGVRLPLGPAWRGLPSRS